jgi:hypothetical protein
MICRLLSVCLLVFAIGCRTTSPNAAGLASRDVKAQKFSCSGVGGSDNEEHRLSFDLEKRKAEYFDNDSSVILPETDRVLLEARPPQIQYTFSGPDRGGRDTLSIRFNSTLLTASLTITKPSGRSQTLEAENGCRPDENVDL